MFNTLSPTTESVQPSRKFIKMSSIELSNLFSVKGIVVVITGGGSGMYLNLNNRIKY